MRAFTKPQLKRLAARQHYTIIGIVIILFFFLTWYIVRYMDGDESVLNILETCMLVAVILAGLNSILLMFSAYGLIGGVRPSGDLGVEWRKGEATDCASLPDGEATVGCRAGWRGASC